MMLSWMLYVVVVTALLGGAGLAVERSAQISKAPTRWVWGATIIASLVIPTVISSVSIQVPSISSAIDHMGATSATPLRQLTSQALKPSAWLMATTGSAPLSPGIDMALTRCWQAGSALLAMAILLNGLLLGQRRRAWQPSNIAGANVYIAEDMGPAVVGLLRPCIVVPRWLFTMSAADQELVIAHERAHLRANDGRLLAIAILLIVTMPWNLPLWWQLRRLRFAIEVDCDARVLDQGHEILSYGAALVTVGARQSNPIVVVAAMAESRSFLEERIRKMVSKRKKFAWLSATGMACLGMAFVAGAAEVSPPNAAAPQTEYKEVAVDPQVLERYVGFYQLNATSVMAVTRDGDQLSTQLTGQPPVAIFPRSPTEFFLKVVNAQISFIANGGANATSLVLHQGGADMTMPRIDAAKAAQINQQMHDKFKSQAQSPDTEAALRRLADGIISGKPNYEEMGPAMAAATRKQLPQLHAIAQFGAVRSVKFLGVGPQGQDVYTVWQENGVTHWNIALDQKGLIVMATVNPGP